MTEEEILREINSLPPEAQRQVEDFIALLRERYEERSQPNTAHTSDLTNEPFVGMWSDRADMDESSAWVRNIRETHWVK